MTENPPIISNELTIYILSGGAGASGEQLVHTVLAQFPASQVRAITLPNIRTAGQVEQAVVQAAKVGALLVHTLVDSELRGQLVALAGEQNVPAIDLMGPLLAQLAESLGQPPLEQPGLYRKLNQAYYERVASIEYSMAHDDGQNPEGWGQADALLLGVSRVGKTPLSLYLSVLGWKVANYPLVRGIELPAQLYQVAPDKVIGLTMQAGQLLEFRRQRQRRLGTVGPSSYTDPAKILEELEFAKALFTQHHFRVLDVTDKPIETTADEIIRWLST